jgi:murein hydrolase activator
MVHLSLRSLHSFLSSRKHRKHNKPGKLSKPVFFAFCFLLLALSFFLFVSFVFAATPREEYRKIKKEMREKKEKIEKVGKRERSILSDLEETGKELSTVETDLRKFRKRLNNTKLQISRVEAEISLNRGSIDRQREWLKRKLRAMQKYSYPGDIMLLLSNTEDISELAKSWKNLEYIALYENRILNSYKENLKSLQEKEKQLKGLEAELVENTEKVRSKEADLAGKKTEKEALLASVQNEKSSYEKMFKELKEASRRLLDVIRESEKNTYRAKGFSGLRGKLLWPVEGRIAIPYGSSKDPRFNTPVFKSGIFIQTGDDINAKAVYAGKVVFAEWFKGYGRLMIVNHGGGYHTLYGSLSEIFSKVGDIINSGQVIGRVGDSGILDTPGLYFEVRYKGKPLDPVQWLKKR